MKRSVYPTECHSCIVTIKVYRGSIVYHSRDYLRQLRQITYVKFIKGDLVYCNVKRIDMMKAAKTWYIYFLLGRCNIT